MTSTRISSQGSHAGQHRCRPGALAALMVGAMLALSPSAAMGQADDQYLPPDRGPGNDGGSQTPGSSGGGSPSAGGSSGSGGGGSDADSSGGTGQADSAPAGAGESSSPSSAGDDDEGSGGSERRSHGDGRDLAKELANLSPNGEAVDRPPVAVPARTESDSSTATIAIVAGIMLVVTGGAVLMRRRLRGSGGP